jgi:hypothetical protein
MPGASLRVWTLAQASELFVAPANHWYLSPKVSDTLPGLRDPRSRAGQLDISAPVIRAMAKLRLAAEVKRPDPQQIQRRRAVAE